jgi:hypothetical protein
MYGCGGSAFAPAPFRSRIDQIGSTSGKTITAMAPGSVLITGSFPPFFPSFVLRRSVAHSIIVDNREIHTFVDGAAQGTTLEPVRQEAWNIAIGNRFIIDVATTSAGQGRLVVLLAGSPKCST